MKKRKKPRRVAWLILLLAVIVVFACFLPGFIERMRYPIAYEAEIREHAAVYSLPPALIAAVVNTESGYDCMAVSSVGARGLMQIMPATGEWVHRKLHPDAEFADDMLYDAHTNLSFGCWYMNFLLNRYDGNLLCAVSAYHAGQGNVDAWLKDERYSDTGKTIDRFPDSAGATRHYVQKVWNAYEYYTKAYEKQK